MNKLILIISHCSTGGMPEVALNRVKLIKNELDVYVIEWSNVTQDYIIQKNRFKKLFQQQPDHFITLGDDKSEILKIIQDIDPQYVHFEEMPEFFVPFDIAVKIYSVDRKYKIFETTHSSDYNVDDKTFFPDKFLFVSQYNCFKFSKFNIPTEVIEFPVEKKKRDPERKLELMKKLNLDPKYKHVLNVGLFTRRKNQGYAFEIARKMEDKPVMFHFIGNQAGNFEDYWKPLMKNVPKNVKLWGERDDTFDFYDACDLFLFTSRGFRYDKELNPLVIKEALEHQIPQFIFPLDVYNRKYDIEHDTINYLFGDIDIDAGLVRNFLFKRELPWENNYLHPYPPMIKHKIRAVHLLLEEDDRSSESIKEMEKLKDYGIDYVQHINKRYTDTPPKEFCERPWDVGRLGSYSLRGPHYGNYTSFRKAILTEFSEDVDFLMIMESDCKLTIPMEDFVNKVFESCDYINKYNIYYMSFGDNKNLRTGEMVSDVVMKLPEVDWMYETNKIIGIQCIMFPKFCKDYVQRSYETCLWDVSDLYFNNVFKYKKKGIAPYLTNQIEGLSTIQGENITHFLKKDENNLKDKNSNDILVEFNPDDKRFHFVLSDFYQKEIDGFKITVKSEGEDNIYTVGAKLNPHSSTWIEIPSWSEHDYFDFDIYYKNNLLFTKKIIMNKNIKKEIIPDIKLELEPEIKQAKYQEIEEKYIGKENEFDVSYDENENKIWLKYTGKKTILDIIVGDIDSNFPIYFIENTIFENSYFRWINPGPNFMKDYPKFNGFSLTFKDSETKQFCFRKTIKLRNTKPLCNIDYYSEIPYTEYENYFHTFHLNEFEKLNLSEKDKWVIDLGSSTGTFIGYALQNGVQNIIGVEAENTSFNISLNTFKNYKNVKIVNRAIYKKSDETMNLNCFFGSEKDKLTFNGSLIEYGNVNKKMSVKTISLIDLINIYNIDKIDVLKCDIEGYEWELFDNLSDEIIQKIDRIHLEFHMNFGGEMRKLFDRLTNLGYDFISEDHIIDSVMATIIFYKKGLLNKNKIELKKENNILKNEELVVILTYPDTKVKNDITKRCIENIKKSGRKILLASHYPVSNELQSMVDYYLFDSYNPLIEHTLYKYYWSDMGNMKVDLNLDKLPNYNNLNQSLCVLNNIENSIRFANQLGYKRVINVSYDFILNDDNISKINELCTKLNTNNKQGYFMRYVEGNMVLYKSVFFIINTDFYSNIFKNPRTPDKYNQECKNMDIHNFLEYYYEGKLKNHEIDLLIEDTDEEKLFNNDEINLFSGVEYLNVIPVKDQPNSFVIWYNSSNKNDNRRLVLEFKNGNNIETVTHVIKSRSYYYRKLTLNDNDSYTITANFMDFEGKNFLNKYVFEINKDNIQKLSENGFFTEK